MIDETIRKLEARIREADGATPEAREELLALVAKLREVLDATARTHSEDAAEIARRTAEAAENAEVDSDLEEAIREFEATHPRLVGAVQSLLRTLADAGI